MYALFLVAERTRAAHHLLTLKLLQTCMSVFLLLDIKEDILKNDWNQTVFLAPFTP